jgi:hypothetical protein
VIALEVGSHITSRVGASRALTPSISNKVSGGSRRRRARLDARRQPPSNRPVSETSALGDPERLLSGSDADALERNVLRALRDLAPPQNAKNEAWARIRAVDEVRRAV